MGQPEVGESYACPCDRTIILATGIMPEDPGRAFIHCTTCGHMHVVARHLEVRLKAAEAVKE